MNKVVLFLLTGTLALGLVSLHMWPELHAERTRSAALQSVLDQLGIPSPHSDGSGTGTQPVLLQGRVEGIGPDAIALPPPDPVIEEELRWRRESRDREQALLRDPAYREAMLEQYRRGMREMNADLARYMDLSPAQFNALVDLMARQQLQRVELGTPIPTSAPTDPSGLEETRRFNEHFATQQQELATLLGPEKWSEYREYMASLDDRSQVMQLQGTLMETDTPLRDSQVRPLVRILHQQTRDLHRRLGEEQRQGVQAASQSSRATLEYHERQLAMLREHNERTNDAAAAVLNDKQLEALARQQESRVQMYEREVQVNRARLAAEERGGVPEASRQRIPYSLILVQNYED